MKEAMRDTIDFGEKAGGLADDFKWRRLTSEEIEVVEVLRRSARLVLRAQDVLDQMEENDAH